MRRLFTVVAAVSLLFCCLFIIARVRSHYAGDCFIWASGGRCVMVDVFKDSLTWLEYEKWPTTESFTWRRMGDPGPVIFGDSEFFVLLDREGHLANLPPRADFARLRFPRDAVLYPIPWPVTHDFYFSTWITITALMPAAWICVAVIAANGRRSDRLCGCCSCGYSLTGNISGLCPECGTTVKISN